MPTTTYDPCAGLLKLDTTYYWAVDAANAVNTWPGDIWEFTTTFCYSVDDFEDYTSVTLPNTWTIPDPLDNTATIAVNGDGEGEVGGFDSDQSLQIDWNLTFADFGSVSYTTRSISDGNWDSAGAKALVLYFYGDAGNPLDLPYVKLNSSKVTWSGDAAAVQEEEWHEWNIALSDFSGLDPDAVSSIELGLDPVAKGIGVILFDQISACPPRCVPALSPLAGDITEDCIVDADDLLVLAENYLAEGEEVTASEPCDANRLVALPFTADFCDVTGNGYNGVAVNAPTLTGGYVELNGDNHIDIGHGFNLVNPFDGSQDFSIVVTFRTEEPGILISSARDNTPDNHAMSLFIGDVADIFGAHYDNFWIDAARVEGEFDDGEWHTVVTTYDAEEEMHLVYFDGIPGGENYFDPNIPNISEDTVRIGNSKNAEYPAEEGAAGFIGDINDVTIYDMALSWEEVLSVSGVDSVEIVPEGNVYEDAGGAADQIIDLKDYAVIGDDWLVESLWP